MDAEEYQKQAARTLIDQLGFDISDRDIMLVWNAVGLAGETGELIGLLAEVLDIRPDGFEEYRLKAIKELGDCYWYAAGICTKMAWSFEPFANYLPSMRWPISHSKDVLVASMGKILEHVKKSVFHQHGIVNELIAHPLRDYCYALIEIGDYFLVDKHVVWDANIEKLKKRYPQGYNSQDSIKRIDTTEPARLSD